MSAEPSLRELFEKLPVLVVVHRAGLIAYVNAAAVHALGTPAEALEGRPLTALTVAQEGAAPAPRPEPAGERYRRWNRAGGEALAVELTELHLPFEGAGATVLIARDVTERLELGRKVMWMDRMSAVGALVAGLGHEINNPLAYITSNLGFVREQLPVLVSQLRGGAPARTVDSLQEELEEVLAEAADGAERIRQIVADLKVFSRPDVPPRGPVDLQAVVTSAVNMVRNEVRHRATVSLDVATVPPVPGNPAQLGQLFLNLLVHAARSLPEGDVEKHRLEVRGWPEADRAVLEISATGPGIPPELLKRMFDPLFLPPPEYPGLGLGLALCDGIVQAHQGELTLCSAPDAGTTVRVCLPTAQASSDKSGHLDLEGSQAPARRRILLVDDEPSLARALGRHLSLHHEVTQASSGEEALAHLEAGERFDAILCDLMMPNVTGMDVYERLLALDPPSAERMVFMSGGAFTPRSSEFLTRVDNPRLEKPIELDHLDQELEAVLRRAAVAQPQSHLERPLDERERPRHPP